MFRSMCGAREYIPPEYGDIWGLKQGNFDENMPKLVVFQKNKKQAGDKSPREIATCLAKGGSSRRLRLADAQGFKTSVVCPRGVLHAFGQEAPRDLGEPARVGDCSTRPIPRASSYGPRVENRHVAKVNSYDSFALGVEPGTWR
eukprot:COSAG05_NODE_1771_length_4112_cov_443.355594_2_plen_144_part_00